MPFVWENPKKGAIKWWAEYDHDQSDYNGADILLYKGGEIIGNIVINVNSGSIEDVVRWDVGVFAGSDRLISSGLRVFLNNKVGEQLGFFPTLCRCRDGDLIGYSILAPTRNISCVDLNKTEVTDWLIPGEIILRYRSIALKENCLEPMGICRDAHIPRFTIVGDKLADLLTEAGFKGLRFVKIEEAFNPLGKG